MDNTTNTTETEPKFESESPTVRQRVRAKSKWHRDTDAEGERYATWNLMPVGTDPDESHLAIAHVSPVWAGSARMSGAPSHWQATIRGVNFGRRFHGVKDAKAAVDAMLAI